MTSALTTTQAIDALIRPGERLLNGKPYVFNSDLLNDHLAREAIRSAPDGFEGWGDVQLDALRYDCLRFLPRDRDVYAEASLVLMRVEGELTCRGHAKTSRRAA